MSPSLPDPCLDVPALATLARWADALPALIACYDADTRDCLYANARHAALIGRRNLGELERGSAHEAEVARGLADAIERLRAGADRARFEAPFAHGEGTDEGGRAWAAFDLLPERDDGGRLRRCLVFAIEVARPSPSERLALRDELTGLPNRRAFMQSIEALLAEARVAGDPLALLVIDIDHFRRINDSLGHGVGDAVLQKVAGRIRAVLRASDQVARFGGDEFMVLVGGRPGREDVADVADKLLEAVSRPLAVPGNPTISLVPSIGIAMFPNDGLAPAELIRHADTAMYRAKARGRATTQFFEPSLASDAYAALVLEDELGRALQRGEFELHYQPQVRAADGLLVGAEALIRWRHPRRGLLAPAHFIALAEEQRLMRPIGAWVLREAAAAARRWHDAGLRGVPVAVNLSARQFEGADFVDSVAAALDASGLPGHLLELELTERMLMNELSEVSPKLAELKSLGIRLSVDDFGTGYSSLGQLKSLPIDKMKIDRSFVSDLPEARDSVAIARAVIQMGRSLGIAVIAEGVETRAQCDFLAGERCDELQGVAISPPLCAASFDGWVAARH